MMLTNNNETVHIIIYTFTNKIVELPCFQYRGCSVVGFDRSTYYRYVQVDTEFSSTKALLHTLFHILGRYHEHERADREKYVNVIKENIIEGTVVKHIFTRVCICVYVCNCTRAIYMKTIYTSNCVDTSTKGK